MTAHSAGDGQPRSIRRSRQDWPEHSGRPCPGCGKRMHDRLRVLTSEAAARVPDAPAAAGAGLVRGYRSTCIAGLSDHADDGTSADASPPTRRPAARRTGTHRIIRRSECSYRFACHDTGPSVRDGGDRAHRVVATFVRTRRSATTFGCRHGGHVLHLIAFD